MNRQRGWTAVQAAEPFNNRRYSMKATGMGAIVRMGVAATAMGLVLALTAGIVCADPIPVEGQNWTMTMHYVDPNPGVPGTGAVNVNYDVNGVQHNDVSLDVFGTVAGAISARKINSGLLAVGVGTGTATWNFAVPDGSIFGAFTFDPASVYVGRVQHSAAWQVSINGGAYEDIWYFSAYQETVSVGLLDLRNITYGAYENHDFLAGQPTSISIRINTIKSASYDGGGVRVLQVEHPAASNSALTVNASIAIPKGTIMSIQ